MFVISKCKECINERSVQLRGGSWIHTCGELNEITDNVRDRKRKAGCPLEKGGKIRND